ncbi:MAG TPA: hypothetical protein VFC47_10250 [Caulobacteraceae bacterium]|nr:hypothetical protein [Caulobacteraceae bacterium]
MLRDVKVLIADDEPFIAYALAASVEDARGEVLGPCASIAEAWEILKSGPAPHAAILDVNLSDGEVTPVAEHLLTRGIHVIFHTGVGVPASLRATYPALVCCPKPTAPERLVRRLRNMIAG